MPLSNHIGRVAEIMHLPASTLRYWDQCGLLRFERDPGNNYRRFSTQTVIDLCDVALYRDMAIPLRQIRALPAATPEQLRAVLGQSEAAILAEIEQLRERLRRLREKQTMIDRLERLAQTTEVVTEALPAMQPEDFGSEQTIQAYLADNYSSTAYLSAERPGLLQYGIILPGGGGPLLRAADPEPRRYCKGLLRVVSTAPHANNADELRAAVTALGHRPGDLVARYLITACEDQRYDYYEAWTELR